MFNCSWTYKIYLPVAAFECDKCEDEVPGHLMQCLEGLLGTYFGGFTKYTNCDGSWKEDKASPSVHELVDVYEIVTDKQDVEKQLEHIKNFILGWSNEKVVFMTKTPTSIMTFERKDYND